MSDEEKEARERIGKLYYEANENCIKYEKIIEKQQKEIEDLKNGQIDFWISDKEIEERIRNKFVNKDKIKAKIEEVQNMKEKAKDIVFKSSLNYIEAELQSLLQEEENNE